jgi:hypothetical protein
MMAKEYSHPELAQLAAEVVEKILSDESLSDTLAERVAKKVDCPPHTLCCSKNHVCSGHGGFACSAPFRCQNGHEEKFMARGF